MVSHEKQSRTGASSSRPEESAGSGGDTGATRNSRRSLIGGSLAGFTAAALLGGRPGRADGGPLASATISFGSWAPPVDRFPNLNPRFNNHHHLCPEQVTIKSGGCVNFIIAGLHHVLVYDDGTQPGDINAGILISPTNPAAPPLIADPNRRIYRGLDPTVVPQDRVEVVHFDRPGTYLVICGVLPHFREGMVGFVRVLP